MPDAYETAHNLDPDNGADAAADEDGDGVSNAQEYLAGTDPQDRQSCLKIDRVSLGPGGTQLEFGVSSNKTYAVQYRERFGESAWLVLTNLPASTRNETAVIIDPEPFGQRFYRLRTPRVP